MIEILTPGHFPEGTKEIHTFKCHYCGCVVKADQADYYYDPVHFSYHTSCPTCHRIIDEFIH